MRPPNEADWFTSPQSTLKIRPLVSAVNFKREMGMRNRPGYDRQVLRPLWQSLRNVGMFNHQFPKGTGGGPRQCGYEVPTPSTRAKPVAPALPCGNAGGKPRLCQDTPALRPWATRLDLLEPKFYVPLLSLNSRPLTIRLGAPGLHSEELPAGVYLPALALGTNGPSVPPRLP